MWRKSWSLLLLSCGLVASTLCLQSWAYDGLGGQPQSTGNLRTTFGNAPFDWVEGTEAMDDGATRDFYNRAALLPWDNFLGDWRDANDVAQGPRPYASLDVIDLNDPRYLEWTVSQLVQGWVDGTYRNQGLVMRLASGSASYNFRSREHAVASERPELVIVTASGTEIFAPPADTYVAASTFGGFGDSDEMRISPDRNALLRFDLTGIPLGTPIFSATLRIWVFAEFGSSEVGIYRSAQGHDEPPSDPIPGIAAAFDLDVGLGSHPDVHLFADFESATWGDNWTFGTGANTLARVTSDPPILFETFDRHALRVRIPDGENTGMNVGFNFEEEIGSEPEELYFRYYLRVGDDWNTLDGGKLPGMAGRYGVAGWGGRRSDGTNGWSARGLFREAPPPGNPLGDHLPIGNYVYHADMAGNFGDNHLWQNDYRGILEKNRWYSVEQYLKMNTPGLNDGILRAWIDGRLAWEKLDWRWRDIPTLKIEQVWMNVYHGGTAPVNQDVTLYIDNVVIATQYIGPVGNEVIFSDGLETGDTSEWSSTRP